jgi:hypothetical protein
MVTLNLADAERPDLQMLTTQLPDGANCFIKTQTRDTHRALGESVFGLQMSDFSRHVVDILMKTIPFLTPARAAV